MRYDDQDRESSNVEDRRGEGGGGGFGMPGGIPIRIGGPGGMSLTGILVVGAICLLLGINPLDVLFGNGQFPDVPQLPQTQASRPARPSEIQGLPGQAKTQTAGEDQQVRFVRRVLADTEDVWTNVFQNMGKRYTAPTLVIFSNATRTACGTGVEQMGPFYCPLDRKVYIDLTFYDELQRKFHAPGEFAQAYVIAHEVGHHVQTLLGISDKVQNLRENNPQQGNALSVRMELQADCFAGVWAHLNDQLHNRLEPGDIESALNAASQIGDDTLQKRAQGRVVPESFTHGSSEQRVRWFQNGYKGGDISACDTFRAAQL